MSEHLIATNNSKATVNTGIGQVINRQNHGVQQQQQQNGVMPHYGGGAEKCARCSKSVYLAEKKVGAGRAFHTSCFSCQTCNRKLDATTLSEHKGEVYCKTCYTRQFGVHGLVSGVTMTTEQPAKEIRHSRRSSYGSDLDAPVITHEQTRPRAHSNDNMLRGETSAVNNDEVPKMFPWRNEVLPEQHLPKATNEINHGMNNIVDKQYQRPVSQIGFEKLIETTYTGNNQIHTNGTSALIDMPVISPPKRLDSAIEPIQMPTLPIKTNERSRSPSPTATDIYQREMSRENPTDISDNFARLTLYEINNQLYANENIATNKIASENPLLKQTYSHSTSQENKQTTITTNTNTNHSRDSSPSTNVNSNNNNRSPSPTSGYGSSGVHGETISRDSTSSPPSAFVPQHDYLNTRQSNSNVVDRQPLSPSPSKANNLPSPSIGGKYSTIGALIKPHRPLSQLNTPTDEFNN